MVKQAKTAIEWLQYGEELLENNHAFFGQGKDNVKDEAAQLIMHTLKISKDTPEEVLQEPLSTDQIAQLKLIFNKRAKDKVPAAYLTQSSYYSGLEFYIDERVLIPRSPLFELIVNYFEPFIDSEDSVELLDLCCGSGCLGIAAKYYCEFINTITLADISDEALEVTKINIDKFNLQKDSIVIKSDCFKSLAKGTNTSQFDIILCNPPYVSSVDMGNLPKEFRYEPALALDGRKNRKSKHVDGLEIVHEIIKESKHYLTDNGWLFIEVGYSFENFEKHYSKLDFIELELESNAVGIYAVSKSSLIQYSIIS